MYASRTARKGFTLVEILIVVIILGILAAIVIPQFTNASEDARASSLTSQLQTIRSQIELYKLQHRDEPPTAFSTSANGDVFFASMIVKTNDDHTTTGTPRFGPYLQGVPVNNVNGNSNVVVVATDPDSSTTVAASGWVYSTATGKFYATDKAGTALYAE